MKQMRDENLMKFSDRADRVISDTTTANVLLCYVLYRLQEPVSEDLLYEAAVGGGIISYFTFQDSLDSLRELGSIRPETGRDGEERLVLTPVGEACARQLKSTAAKSSRDAIVLAATRAMRLQRHQREVTIDYEPHTQGCYLRVVLHDRELTLLEMKLFTPDKTQAQALGERVLSNPSALYSEVMRTVTGLEEEPIDLSDN